MHLYHETFRVNTVVFTNSSVIAQFAKRKGLNVQPVFHSNSYGFPELRWLLIRARELYPANQYIFINSDILINPFLFHMAYQLDAMLKKTSPHVRS